MRTPLEIAEAFSPAERITSERPFYLVGIGGAGMSSLAFMLQKRGIPVAGSDAAESATTASLREAGIPVRIGHSEEDIRAGDQVVLSDAIDLKTSPEVAAAREQGCELFRRSQLLNWLLKGKKIIAVTGTHGKTTVTGMIGAGLRAAGMDPTIVVGAYVPEFGGSVVEGEGEYAVVEACEAYNAFLDLDPFIVVLTNLEPDHLDFHGSYKVLVDRVKDFLQRVPVNGSLVLPIDISKEITDGANGEVVWIVDNQFYCAQQGIPGADWRLSIPGLHNERNAGFAVYACLEAGAEGQKVMAGVCAFRGAERRLERLALDPIGVYDDYAHHPTEVRASVQALKERHPDRRLLAVFQPHLYSRTRDFLAGFAEALSLADVVVLTDIYPAREDPIPGISSARIAELVTKPVWYIPSRHLLPRFVANLARKGDVVVGMGAGNISEFAPALIQELNRRTTNDERRNDGGLIAHRASRIAVVYGGDSAEREVSIHSGRAIRDALEKKGYEAFLVDVTELLLGKGDVSQFTGSERPDLAFLAVHGTNAEDGALQGFFKLLHIPFTGSDLASSALCMDKQRTKTMLEAHGLPIPQGVLVHSADDKIDLKPPLIVKPNAQGSTVGLSFVHSKAELKPAIEKALHYDSAALVEEWIQGMEISVPVLGGKALSPVEIVPNSGQYDFAAKYEPGATKEICPARLPEEVLQKAMRMAEQAHAAMGCEGATRTDFIVRNNVDPVVLEVNTLPGMTGTSLLPKSAQTAGMSFEDLVDWIAQDALKRHAAKT